MSRSPRFDHDVIVVGKGLFGAAAARHLSAHGLGVAIVGPDEPAGDLQQATVFGSHYDQARIVRLIDSDPTWTQLNRLSASAWSQLEAQSGVSFYEPTGCLYVSPDAHDPIVAAARQTASALGIQLTHYDSTDALKTAYPDFDFIAGSTGFFEPAPAGTVNPRRLVDAHLSLLQRAGGAVLRAVVTAVTPLAAGYQVTTLDGQTLSAQRVLIAAGAFSNEMDLLPRKLALRLESETILLAEVSATEAQRLRRLPPLLYELQTPLLDSIYTIRPLPYHDGRTYLKIGCNLDSDRLLQTGEELRDWYVAGDSDSRLPLLRQTLQQLLPALQIESCHTRRCAITRTYHGKPYIGPVDSDRLYVAVGGNGYGAMASDAVGRIAASVIANGAPPSDFAAATFQPLFADQVPLDRPPFIPWRRDGQIRA